MVLNLPYLQLHHVVFCFLSQIQDPPATVTIGLALVTVVSSVVATFETLILGGVHGNFRISPILQDGPTKSPSHERSYEAHANGLVTL